MKEYLKAVLDAQLFKGINAEQAEELLRNMSVKLCSYEKDDIIQWEQSYIDSIGILICGSAVAYRSTENGNNIIMSHLGRSDVFADIIAASPSKISPVSIRALEPTKVVYIEYLSFVSGKVSSCAAYSILMHNYIETVSKRYFALQDRISCLILPSLREKILYFLRERSGGCVGEVFTIPFDRSALAEYLNADRSALSRELSKLKREGRIEYHKNRFTVLR